MPARMRTILLLEDEPLLSWDIEDMIRSAKLAEPVVLSSCSAASAWLDSHSPDVAVLDIVLADGESTAIAETLVERNVPFVVHSVCSRSERSTEKALLKGTRVPKLSDHNLLLQAVSDCLEQRN